MIRHSGLFVLMMAMSAIASCGDDEGSSESMAPDSGSDAGDSGGSGGTSGSGGNGGNGGSAGSAGVGGSPLTVPCGSQTCESSAAAMGLITACCVDEATSTCGTSFMGSPCAEAVAGDPRCPSLDIMGFIMLASCCTEENQCGIDASMFGMPGCIDLATAGEQAEMMGGGMSIDFPEPQACSDETDGGTDDDAGN